MVNYIRQLIEDVEFSIQMASQLPERDWFTEYDDSEIEANLSAAKLMSLPAIYQIPAEAFPPEKLLTDIQVAELTCHIQRLWTCWRLCFKLPTQLSGRQQYKALMHSMQKVEVAWSAVKGGNVNICHYEEGSYCPFGFGSVFCHCKELEKAVQNDLAIWEEHVRSQGLDPYHELSVEEGAAFEAQMRLRNKKKSQGEEGWLGLGFLEILNFENQEKDKASDKDILDEDWSAYFYWENDSSESGLENVSSDIVSGNPDHFFSENQPDDDDDCEFPFF